MKILKKLLDAQSSIERVEAWLAHDMAECVQRALGLNPLISVKQNIMDTYGIDINSEDLTKDEKLMVEVIQSALSAYGNDDNSAISVQVSHVNNDATGNDTHHITMTFRDTINTLTIVASNYSYYDEGYCNTGSVLPCTLNGLKVTTDIFNDSLEQYVENLIAEDRHLSMPERYEIDMLEANKLLVARNELAIQLLTDSAVSGDDVTSLYSRTTDLAINSASNPFIQFPRLISEIVANVEFGGDDTVDLLKSMDLSKSELNGIFDMAQCMWESIKANRSTTS